MEAYGFDSLGSVEDETGNDGAVARYGLIHERR
jgi:hypothetical protein